MQAGVFCFFAGGSGILNSNWHVWQWKEEAMLSKIHTHDFKSHFWQDFLAYNINRLLHQASQRVFGDGVCQLLV